MVTLPKNWMTLFGTPTMMFVKRAQINVNAEMTQLPLWTNSTLTMQQETSLTTILTLKIPTQQRMTRMFSITTLTTNLFQWNLYLTEESVSTLKSRDRSSATAQTTSSLTSYSLKTRTQTWSLTMTPDRRSTSFPCPPLEQDRRKISKNLTRAVTISISTSRTDFPALGRPAS